MRRRGKWRSKQDEKGRGSRSAGGIGKPAGTGK